MAGRGVQFLLASPGAAGTAELWLCHAGATQVIPNGAGANENAPLCPRLLPRPRCTTAIPGMRELVSVPHPLPLLLAASWFTSTWSRGSKDTGLG